MQIFSAWWRLIKSLLKNWARFHSTSQILSRTACKRDLENNKILILFDCTCLDETRKGNANLNVTKLPTKSLVSSAEAYNDRYLRSIAEAVERRWQHGFRLTRSLVGEAETSSSILLFNNSKLTLFGRLRVEQAMLQGYQFADQFHEIKLKAFHACHVIAGPPECYCFALQRPQLAPEQ